MLKIFCGMKGYRFSLSLAGGRASSSASLDNLKSSSLLEETVSVFFNMPRIERSFIRL
jgi:hypothetical protein